VSFRALGVGLDLSNRGSGALQGGKGAGGASSEGLHLGRLAGREPDMDAMLGAPI
jgi:hypothetical protein